MADILATLAQWSSTSGSNLPVGATTIGTGLDDNLREIQGVTVRGLSHKGADIASAATTDLGAIEGLMHDITGTTTITSFGTVRAGIWKILKFENTLTVTHNASTLILPGGANITTADGDTMVAVSEGAGAWRVIGHTRANEIDGEISIARFLTRAQITDVLARTNLVDTATKFQEAIDFCGNWAAAAAAPINLVLFGGSYRINSLLHIRPYVNIRGAGVIKTAIYPVISSGAALSADAGSGVESLYMQKISSLMIDCAGITGTGYGLLAVTAKHCRFEQVAFWNSTVSQEPVTLVKGGSYGVVFDQCNWYNNKAHHKITTDNPVTSFSSVIMHNDCVFEFSTDQTTNAVHVRDASGVTFKGGIIQSNKAIKAMFVECTSTMPTTEDHLIDNVWFEDNGDGQANSDGIYLKGVSGKPLTGVVIKNNNFHQSIANKPNYQIRAEWTDLLRVRDNHEYFGAVFIKDGGNNTNWDIDPIGVSQVELRDKLYHWACGKFAGVGSVTIDTAGTERVSTITRSSAGTYVVTLSKTMSNTSYKASTNAADFAGAGKIYASYGRPTSTTQFTIYVMDDTGAFVDADSVTFDVFGAAL